MELYRGAGSVKEDQGEAGILFLWQLHNGYICGQTRSGLVIIDQHAAHERILYEAALAAMKENRGSSQQLLFPQLMDLSAAEYDTLLEILPNLERLGFDVRSLSKRSIAVYGIPAEAREWRDGQMLRDIIDEYASTGRSEKDPNEAVAKSFACHAAVKGGQPLGPEEMNALIDQLFATSVPHGDPHGRPTYLQISLAELERRFGRA
jgi:DNA mismatch repair protein MutL